jgi:hypothetical protein
MNEEIKLNIVLLFGAFFIGIMLEIFGLTIKNLMWWYIGLPLAIILAFTHKEIWNFFANLGNLFSKNKPK